MTLSHFGFGSPHSNAVGDRVAQNLIHGALLRWIRCKIAIRAISLQQPLALQKAGHALSNGRHIQKMPSEAESLQTGWINYAARTSRALRGPGEN